METYIIDRTVIAYCCDLTWPLRWLSVRCVVLVRGPKLDP